MIRRLEIVAFKRFQREIFNLSNLTVLTGLNGSGKTSFIQSLLLLAEASSSPSKSVRLNGPFGMELGAAGDVRNWESDGLIELSVETEGELRCNWKFRVPDEDALFLNVLEAPHDLPVALSTVPRTFTYLSAERLGPRTSLISSALPAEELEVGMRGEGCAHMLAVLGSGPLLTADREHPESNSADSLLLKYQVERWMAEIVRPIEIDAVHHPGPMASVLRFRPVGGEWVRAPNMGFGVSYALPIVVAGLTAQAGGLLIVENPEAHLHPAGQSRMGSFLAWLAARDVQVVVETHSDHVLNGMRLAIAEKKYLSAKLAVVHFFDSGDQGELVSSELKFSEFGTISTWPRGFFDQYQIDVASLGRIRRQR
jgi:predicted ATPase